MFRNPSNQTCDPWERGGGGVPIELISLAVCFSDVEKSFPFWEPKIITQTFCEIFQRLKSQNLSCFYFLCIVEWLKHFCESQFQPLHQRFMPRFQESMLRCDILLHLLVTSRRSLQKTWNCYQSSQQMCLPI